MIKSIYLGILVSSLSAMALCPFQSRSLQKLRDKAQNLDHKISQLQNSSQCPDLISISSHLKTITQTSTKLYSALAKSKSESNTNLNVLSEFEGDISNTLGSIREIGDFISHKRSNDHCSNEFNKHSMGQSVLSVFNELSPLIVSSFPAFAPYTEGIRAAGNIASSIIDFRKSRRDRYSMNSPDNRKTFIEISCLLHDLGMNTYSIDKSLDGNEKLFEDQKKDYQVKLEQKIREITKDGNFLKMAAADTKEIKEVLLSKIDEALDNALLRRIRDNEDELDDLEEGENKKEKKEEEEIDFGEEGTSLSSEYVCKLTHKYLLKSHQGISRLDRLKSYLSFYQIISDIQGQELISIEFEIKNSELSQFMMVENVQECELEKFTEIFEFVSSQISTDTEGLLSLDNIIYKEYALEVDSLKELYFYKNLLERKQEVLMQFSNENVSIDLSEIYTLEKKIVNSMFQSKAFSYYWLLYNAERGLDYVNIFKKKLARKEYASYSDKNKKCNSIMQTLRDYRHANNLFKSTELYCEQMDFLTSSVEHAAYYSMCNSLYKTSSPHSYNPYGMFGRKRNLNSKTAIFSNDLNMIESQAKELENLSKKENCYRI